MIPISGTAVLTAAEMRAAEHAAVANGISLAEQMRRAGEGVATVVQRLATGAPVLVLCGPGNNGGDGWITAITLARAGYPVRVAASGEPRTELARAARAGWTGPMEPITGGEVAPVVVDALFGTGLSRPLPDQLASSLAERVRQARLSIAIDLPSGVSADDGRCDGGIPPVDLTLALGAVKPAHLLQPGARRCGQVRVVATGIEPVSHAQVLSPPSLASPGPDANKFTRGMVAVIPGPMAGASLLASTAAMRAGAGYVLLLDGAAGRPHALVRKPWSPDELRDPRLCAVLIGNGLGRDDAARGKIEAALASGRPLVIDGDALHLVSPEQLARHGGTIVLTPHGGEFKALFGDPPGSKLDQARQAARRSGAVVVFKGADTVIADPTGRAVLASDASDWLSTAGSGDVLAGTTAAMLASGIAPIDAASAAVWLNGEAARRAGASFIADDLAAHLTPARASL